MNDNFKEKILNYLTNNYDIETGVDTPFIREEESITTDIYTLLTAMSSDYVIVNTTTSINNDFIIFYGYYSTATKGFIAIINEDFEMVQLITTYSGGSDLPALYFLNYDEDGYFYGLGVSSGSKKLYLFNNFCVKLEDDDYEVIYRQSYTLDGSLQSGLLYSSINVVKREDTGSYLFIMPYTASSGLISEVIVSTLTINVGSSNEWIHTIYTVSLYNSYSSFYGEWQNDSYFYKLSQNVSGYKQYTGSNGGTLTTTTLTLPISGYGNSVANSLTYSYCCSNASTADEAIFAVYKITSGTSYEELYSFNVEKPSTYATRISLNMINEVICFDYSYPYETTGGFIYYQGVGGRIINDKAYVMNEYNATAFDVPIYFIKRQYNKINYYLTVSGNSGATSYTEIYNFANFNGEEYQALDSMITNSSILYDDDGKIIFARNLYDKTIYDNTTTSTIEIDNNYLNDVNITNKELIGKTNSTLNLDSEVLTKNIYEELYLNFVNSIYMVDDNDSEYVYNKVGATRVNNSVSVENDYNDAKIEYYTANYSDGTSIKYKLSSAEYSTTENKATITFIVYVPSDKTISSIQIKSSDDATTYLTIDTSTLVSDTIYKITQDVEVV